MNDRVDADRLRDLTLELVEIEGPTGDTAAVARRYADILREIGLDAEVLDERFPSARRDRAAPGNRARADDRAQRAPRHRPDPARPTSGGGRAHLGPWERRHEGPVAAATEAVRVVAESGREFPGELALVAIGLHEAPGGRGRTLTWLLESTASGPDYAIVCELSGDRLVAAHMGQATVEIEIAREGWRHTSSRRRPGRRIPSSSPRG